MIENSSEQEILAAAEAIKARQRRAVRAADIMKAPGVYLISVDNAGQTVDQVQLLQDVRLATFLAAVFDLGHTKGGKS